jgi:2-haloacid dehalogenase
MTDHWLTFDCYGTLVDWRTGMSAAIASLGDDAAAVLEGYHRAELEIEARGWIPYRDVLQQGLELSAGRLGVDLNGIGADAFVRHWTEMPVFGDVANALADVRAAGWKIGVITNCDEDLFAGTAKHLPVELDLVVTAERVACYRPDLAHFSTFAAETGADRDTWIHVGTSWVHDVLPAARMGIRSIWTDRDLTGHPPGLATVRLDSLEMLGQAATVALGRQ